MLGCTVSKYIHILVPRTYNFVALHCKRDFVDIIKLSFTKKPMTLILGPRHSRGRSLHVELSKSKRDRRVRQRVVTNLEKEENEGQELQEFPV